MKRRRSTTPGRRGPVSLKKTKLIQMILFGFPGIGKTEKIGELENVLIIHPPTDHMDSIKNIDGVKEFEVADWDDMWSIHEQLQQGLAAKLFPGVDPKDIWVWMDSLSLFQEFGLDEIFANAVARKQSRKEFEADKGEYGINMQRIGRWVRYMVGLSQRGDFNFGIVCHASEIEDVVKEDTKLRPSLTGKDTWAKVMGSVKVCVYMRVATQGKKTVRVMETKPSEHWDAANKLGGLGPKGRLIEPTMTQLVSALQGTNKAGASSRRKRRKSGRRK